MKKSFSMLFVIAFIVVMGTIGMMMMEFGSVNVKTTGDEYLYTQAELYAKSSTEYALMAIDGHDYSSGKCIDKIDVNTTMFDINLTMHYFMKGCPSDCANCSEIKTKESNGSVLITSVVTSKVGEKIKFVRSTIQKP